MDRLVARAIAVVFAAAIPLACSNTSSQAPTQTTHAAFSAPCTSDASCEDGYACTVDRCVEGFCTHRVGPTSGPTACASDQFCVLTKGCVTGKVCVADSECDDGDPCTVDERCEQTPSMSKCTYRVLDQDGDDHPPVACGGDDCDDADAKNFPGNPEICNGRDDNCNAQIDEGAAICGGGVCAAGACKCDNDPNLLHCSATCSDLRTDKKNCGACGSVCGAAGACTDGKCICTPEMVLCPGAGCVNLLTDTNHCGDCDSYCIPFGCSNGLCNVAGGTYRGGRRGN